MAKSNGKTRGRTVGMDLSDRYTHVAVVDASGEVVERGRVRTEPAALEAWLCQQPPSVVVLEVGTHSPWVSRLVAACGHEAVVANARKLRFIFANETKRDRVDAEALARVGRFDRQLLAPIRHRGAQAQSDLALLRTREALVRARTQLVNHVRGAVKAVGGRLPKTSTEAFPHRVRAQLPAAVASGVAPALAVIEQLTQQIRGYDRAIEHLSRERYPETARLRQVPGVGPVTALAYVLIVEDPARFSHSRAVGAYLGLQPRRDQSGGQDPQLRITKCGDPFLRRLLVGAAHYILGPFGPDSDLRRWGLRLAARGGKNAKKRAIVAVARKLAGVLYSLWVHGTDYEALREGSGQPHVA